MRSKTAVLKKCAAFADADAASLRTLAATARIRSVARRAPLWMSGEEAPLVLRSGVVRESGGDEEKPVTFGFFGRGDLIGSDLVHGGRLRTVLEAYDDCVVIELSVPELQRCAEVDLGLVRGLARWENQRVQGVQELLEVVAHGTAPQRLASVLQRLARRFGVRDSRGTIVNLRLTHRELAGLIGATRETVSLTVTQFRKSGWIEVDGKRFVLIDRRALARVAEGETP